MVVEVIPLRYGKIFKRAFSDPEIFSEFASDVLGFPVKVEKVHTEYQYPEQIGFVQTKYDLFAEDVEKRIIVEIQHVGSGDFYDRFLCYHMVSLLEQEKRYDAYGFDRTVYTIVVLTSVPRDGSVNYSVAVGDMNPVDEFGKSVEVYPHRLIFLVPTLVNEKTPVAVKSWLELIKDSLDKKMDAGDYDSATFRNIIDRIKATTMSPEELSEVKDEMAWKQKLEKFRNEGRAEGRVEGRAEGRAEGEAKGRVEARKKIAIAMSQKGLDRKLILESTGIDLETIEKISQKKQD